jgi:DNA-binding NarL/FixJ family response regulator
LTADLAQLEGALRMVLGGGSYWSRSFIERALACALSGAVCRVLTPRQQTVFSALGGGSDPQEVADALGLRLSTVRSVESDLHHILRVQHHGALIRAAVQYGFVHIGPEDVAYPFAEVAAGMSALAARRKT